MTRLALHFFPLLFDTLILQYARVARGGSAGHDRTRVEDFGDTPPPSTQTFINPLTSRQTALETIWVVDDFVGRHVVRDQLRPGGRMVAFLL
ncbi:hypothetical protein LAC81_10010 [Ensifer adhaerens]|uniref:hypothetical protein n=1 Tax=Ensifer adhaerens TaxID=106592 RepID=UPI001CBFD646|nr:hypothetical protein [Ensifer adhaerens]MBZ7922120.1 hypothetical protein [Ensifer adhaerens]UAX94504.1 hypothetical protein LAC78_10005 [Ensifer adhaerens]UAY02139.1 hypothetical protein LAC80_10015 [Ensifer adhaerens]UAY09522.1 hypothetical protein LAC81_10010 [Ensifer adhaerens]